MSLRIRINSDFVGGLAISLFSYGNRINEQTVYDNPRRIIIDEGQAVTKPSLYIPFNESNEFIRELKEAIRIYEGNSPDYFTGELKATKYHLEDLRKLLKVGQ